jgi:hypothetical protein
MKKEVFHCDFHAHTERFAKILGKAPETKPYVKKLIGRLFNLPQVPVLGIANFNDDQRYQRLILAIRHLPKSYQIDRKNQAHFVKITKGKKKIYLIKTDEIETEKGHILVIGYKGNVKHRKLQEVLEGAEKQNCPIIANHPLHKFSLTEEFGKRLVARKPHPLSLSAKDLLKNQSSLDALECNAYFPEDWPKIKLFAERQKIPVTCSSDAHYFQELFQSYTTLQHLNFSSPKSLKSSIKMSFKHKPKLHLQSHSARAKWRHILHIPGDLFGKFLGIVEK